ncbi:MAG: endonuclease III domain-containing protein [Pirellulaceae bacterium]
MHSGSVLHDAYQRLLAAYGPQHWWPGDSPFEIVVGAVLTQNTAWKNVELAIENLRENALLEPRAMFALDVGELAELIRPSGYYRLKAQRLRNLLRVIVEDFDGSLEEMLAQPLDELREQLLRVNGIGPETADSILLYAAAKPTFVVDAYSARVLKRHGWIEPEADYYAIKECFEQQVPADVGLYNEYHALIVRVGKAHCGKKPNCEACPLHALLPESGPCDLA